MTRLSEIFSSVLNLGTNEGLIYLDDSFLLENNGEEEKKSFLHWAHTNDCILFFEHDPENECCSLQLTEKGIRAKDRFTLSAVE